MPSRPTRRELTKPAMAVPTAMPANASRKIMPEPVDVGEHLLRDEHEGEQRAQHAAGRQRIAQRLAIGHGLAERVEHRRESQATCACDTGSVSGMRSALQTSATTPYSISTMKMPRHCVSSSTAWPNDGATHGHGDEHHHRQRHHARHAPAGVAVANDRGRDHARGRGAERPAAPAPAAVSRTRAPRSQAGWRYNRRAMPPSRTGRRPKRSDSGPITNWPMPKPTRKIDSTICGRLADGDVEGGRDVRQRRQHHVHRERIERHDRRNHDHEFGEAHRAVA